MPSLTLSAAHRRSLLVDIARAYVGAAEAGGDNRGALVERFQQAVDGRAAREPWCLSFVQHCVGWVERACTHLGDAVPLAPPWPATEHVLTLWRGVAPAQRIEYPRLPLAGDLMVWRHGESEAGHIGIVVEDYDALYPRSRVRTVEGNTGPGAGVEREGDGVYELARSIHGQGRMRCLGWIRVPWREV